MSSKSLKVFGWADWFQGKQIRAIVAAPSKAAVARAAGAARPSALWNLCETGNALEIQAASACPGVVLYRRLNDRDSPFQPLNREGSE